MYYYYNADVLSSSLFDNILSECTAPTSSVRNQYIYLIHYEYDEVYGSVDIQLSQPPLSILFFLLHTLHSRFPQNHVVCPDNLNAASPEVHSHQIVFTVFSAVTRERLISFSVSDGVVLTVSDFQNSSTAVSRESPLATFCW